jgi:HTH-like domain
MHGLTTLVVALFGRHRGTYGSPRITDEVRAAGWKVSVNTISAIMAEPHLVAPAPLHSVHDDHCFGPSGLE